MPVLLVALLLLALYPPDLKDEGMLGLSMNKTTPQGAVVDFVVPGSPAETAGIQVGDVVTSIGGRSVIGLSSVETLSVCRRPAGILSKVELLRGGKPMTFEAEWAPIPAAILAEAQSDVEHKKVQKIDAWVEKAEGRTLGLMLQSPSGHYIAVGTMVLVPPKSQEMGPVLIAQGKVTRVVSHFRLEVEMDPPAPATNNTTFTGIPGMWDRVCVVIAPVTVPVGPR